MQFASHVSLFVHQHPQGSELMDSRIEKQKCRSKTSGIFVS